MSAVPKATLQNIPEGNSGVRTTLNLMSKLVKHGKQSIAVRNQAGKLTRNLKQKDWLSEVKAIHDFVQNEIRYTKDIRGIETIQTPEVTLNNRYGDCDDKSTLTATLLETIGHPTRFVACGFNGNGLSHVFVQTKIGNHWVSVETTEPVKLGWTPPRITCRMVVHN